MDSFYIEDLKELMLNGKRHETGNAYKIFPFNTRTQSTSLDSAFNEILGNYILEITQNKINNDLKVDHEFEGQNASEHHQLSAFIANDFLKNKNMNADDEFNFSKMLNNFLYPNGSFTPTHPYLFNLINYQRNEKSKEFKPYGAFLADCFGAETRLKDMFNDTTAENILMKVILESAQKLVVPTPYEKAPEYKSILPAFTDLYKEDIAFLQTNRERFFKDFGLLTHYYFFMYIVQVTYKAHSFTNADYTKATPLHFILENEKLSKSRRDRYFSQGYGEVDIRSNYLFAHINALSHLSYNVIEKGDEAAEQKNTVLLYSDLKDTLEAENDPDLMKDFIEKLQEWLVVYREWKKLEPAEVPNTFDELVRSYVWALTKGLHKDAQNRVGKMIKHLGSKLFIKARGSLGDTFNLQHDLLILLTSVIIKEDRMPLKQVFEEFERRGILLDKHSRQEVINLYNSHNILDKKSDSGDAQYVKRIL